MCAATHVRLDRSHTGTSTSGGVRARVFLFTLNFSALPSSSTSLAVVVFGHVIQSFSPCTPVVVAAAVEVREVNGAVSRLKVKFARSITDV